MHGAWRSLPPHLRQILVWSAMWSVLVLAAESPVVQDSHAGVLESLAFWSLIFCPPIWCAAGCCYLTAARQAVLSARWGRLVLAWLLISLCWGLIQLWPNVGFSRSLKIASSTSSRFLHSWHAALQILPFTVWNSLFYGGLLVAAYALSLRSERNRLLLQDASIARGRTAALRGELALANLQRHVEPALLLDVMGEVELLYRSGTDRADELLARLVEFLRCAMPGLKGLASTLQAELQLAAAWTQLQRARAAGAAGDAPPAPLWTLDIAPELPAQAFPSQIMLPLLALAAPGSQPCLKVRHGEEGLRIEVHGLGQPLPASFSNHARLSLRSLLGPDFAFDTGAGPPISLALSLPPQPNPGECRGT
jgi:hypothetical protein